MKRQIDALRNLALAKKCMQDKKTHLSSFNMKTVCLKVNLNKEEHSFECKSSVKYPVMQRDTGLFTQHDKIAITGLYLWVDNEKVMLIIFFWENSLVSVCMTNLCKLFRKEILSQIIGKKDIFGFGNRALFRPQVKQKTNSVQWGKSESTTSCRI